MNLRTTTVLMTVIVSLCAVVQMRPAQAAIQYNGDTYEASFAASTTSAVGKTVNSVLSGDIKNSLTPSSTQVVGGAIDQAVGFFGKTNAWMKEKAGIDFVAILKGIGSLFLFIFEFIIDILKKVL